MATEAHLTIDLDVLEQRLAAIQLEGLRVRWYATGALGCYLCCRRLTGVTAVIDGMASVCMPCEDELKELRAASGMTFYDP